LSASSETLTSSPLSSSSAFPTLTTGIFNSSSGASFADNVVVEVFSNRSQLHSYRHSLATAQQPGSFQTPQGRRSLSSLLPRQRARPLN
jgi:hypothetical protein